MKFDGLGALAAHLLTVKADLKLAEEVCVEKACRMIEKEAKAAIGTYRYDWEPLKPETVARKARGDTPLLETGELRDSIEHVVRFGRGHGFRAGDEARAVSGFQRILAATQYCLMASSVAVKCLIKLNERV
jgi:hypothetical protein